MPEESTQANRGGGFGSAANLMIEALEKASQELESMVGQCLDQLDSFAEGLDESLTLQLNKVVEQSRHLVDSHGNVLEAKRDETIDGLADLEARETEKILLGAADMRKQLSDRVENSILSLSEIMEAQLKELAEMVETPSSALLEKSKDHVLDVVSEGKESALVIKEHGETFEDAMSDKAKEIDEDSQKVIENAKRQVDENLAGYSSQFDAKIVAVQDELAGIVKKASIDLKRLSNRGESSIDEARITNLNIVSEQIDSWQNQLMALRDRFQQSSLEQQSKHQKSYNDEIERKLSVSQDEISRIAQSARKRMTVNQKLFLNTLRRAERQLGDDVDRLMTRFEAAIAQEARVHLMVSGGKLSAGPEVLDKLSHRLKSHGAELVKTFKTQVEQTEQDFARSAQGSNERIESIRQSSVEALEKQVRIMRADLERITRNFHSELSDLNLKLPVIEESGRAAALAVMAYKSAMLSLGND
ncbi:MAG: hypothetical protein IPJ49_06255 [Candidatus Obscuribacter sp.]|jgi:hypothetical protein|nr:hypothetical protein [Candidatus Obscuribacter sp.]